MKFPLSILLLVCSCSLSVAEDMVLKDGRRLEDIHVLEEGADFARVRHSEGIARVDASNLTEAWQQKLHLTPEEVTDKKTKLSEQNKAKIRLQKERDRMLRESLSDAEKSPRYLKGTEILKMMTLYTNLEPLEAEAAALRWNISEAQRVGLSDQAENFKVQLASYEPILQKLQRQREESMQYWKDIQSDYEKLAASSDEKISKLSSQVSTLRKDLNDVKNTPAETRMVVYREPYYTPPQIIVPPVIRPPLICPPRPRTITTTKNSVQIGPARAPQNVPSRPVQLQPGIVPANVRPAEVRPAVRSGGGRGAPVRENGVMNR